MCRTSGERHRAWIRGSSDGRRIANIVVVTAVAVKAMQTLGVPIGGLVRVRFTGFGKYNLEIDPFAYALTSDWTEFLSICQDVLVRVMEIVERAGTRLARPTEVHYGAHDVEGSDEQTGRLSSHARSASRLSWWVSWLVVVLITTSVSAAEEGVEEPSVEPPPRNRIDFAVQWFDAAEGDFFAGSLNYSWVPLAHHSFAATVALIDSNSTDTTGSGFGDLRLQYSWVPSADLTAEAWVPTTLGMGFGLIVPTGDPEEGTGSDRWVAIPNVGWVWNVSERLSFLPTLQYLRSVKEGSAGEEIEAANLELGLLWVARSEFWINYTPSFFRDFEPVVDTNVDHFLTFGKQFTGTFGSSLTLGSIERPPVQNPSISQNSDEFVGITLHFVLPW